MERSRQTFRREVDGPSAEQYIISGRIRPTRKMRGIVEGFVRRRGTNTG